LCNFQCNDAFAVPVIPEHANAFFLFVPVELKILSKI
jgi:hypothetical protein